MTFIALLAMLLPAIFPIAIFFFLRKKQKIVARVFLIVGGALAVFITSLWLLELSGVNTKNNFNQITKVLNKDLVFPADEQQQKYQLLGLSNAAEAFSKYANTNPAHQGEIDTLLETIAHFVTDEENYPTLYYSRKWKNNVFDLIHINNILNYYASTTQQDTFQALNEKINKFLSAQVIRSPYKHLSSFEKDNTYWTADNVQLLASLRLFDDMDSSKNESKRAIHGWTLFCKKEMLYDDSQLLCSAFTAKQKCKEAPHGTQLSASIAALSIYDMAFAKKIWKQYKYHYKKGTLNVFATFEQYHPQELAPAYNKERRHPLDGLRPHFATLKAAACVGDKLVYFQIANEIWLQDILHANEETMLPPEYRWKGFYKKCLIFCAETTF